MSHPTRFPRQTGPHAVDQIVSRAAGAVVVLALFFSLLFVISETALQLRSEVSSEHQRVEGIASQVARTLYGEILIGDHRAIEATKASLLQRHDLSRIAFEQDPDRCRPESFFKQFYSRFLRGGFLVCVPYVIEGVSPPFSLYIESRQVKPVLLSTMGSFLLLSFLLLGFGIVIMLRVRKSLRRSIATPLRELSEDPETWQKPGSWVADEVVTLSQRFKDYIQERDAQRKKTETLMLKASMGELAAQVVHDIRSPLAAFNQLSDSFKSLNQEEQELAQSAVARIQYIAAQLLNRYRNPMADDQTAQLTPEHLGSLIQAILAEKRFRYSTRIGLEILGPDLKEVYPIFVAVIRGEFLRILSNLLDNAFESFEGPGQIKIRVVLHEDSVRISVEDHGKGIPADILPKLGSFGNTYGKAGGSGLGLSHAHTLLETWQGRLLIQSELGKGTQVTMVLPKIDAPSWFMKALPIKDDVTVVIADDDPSIHSLWKTRIKDVLSCYSPSELSNCLKSVLQNGREASTSFFLLCDYDFGPAKETGLETIKRLGVSRSSCLVTTHFDDPKIQAACKALGIRMIPKSMIGFVPIIP